MDTLTDTGRPPDHDTAPAPASVVAASAAVDILQHQPELPGRARRRAGALAATVRASGPGTSGPAGAVVPVVLGPPGTARAAAATCAEPGVRARRRRPPSVPEGRPCLRLTARANLSSDDLAVIRHALTAVAEVKVRA